MVDIATWRCHSVRIPIGYFRRSTDLTRLDIDFREMGELSAFVHMPTLPDLRMFDRGSESSLARGAGRLGWATRYRRRPAGATRLPM